jgi:hypothetical protein
VILETQMREKETSVDFTVASAVTEPGAATPRRDRMARLVERHAWLRVLLHVAVLIRWHRHVGWHLRCIRREFRH